MCTMTGAGRPQSDHRIVAEVPRRSCTGVPLRSGDHGAKYTDVSFPTCKTHRRKAQNDIALRGSGRVWDEPEMTLLHVRPS